MPSQRRLLRVATLPETRRLVSRAAKSEQVRLLAHRARSDRMALLRELARPSITGGRVRSALAHPAAGELASIGAVFLPGRYLPVGWAVAWLGRRILRRLGGGQPDVTPAPPRPRPAGSPSPVSPAATSVSSRATRPASQRWSLGRRS